MACHKVLRNGSAWWWWWRPVRETVRPLALRRKHVSVSNLLKVSLPRPTRFRRRSVQRGLLMRRVRCWLGDLALLEAPHLTSEPVSSPFKRSWSRPMESEGWEGVQNRNGPGREWTTRVDFGEIGKIRGGGNVSRGRR
jgi:hypothetical protein